MSKHKYLVIAAVVAMSAVVAGGPAAAQSIAGPGRVFVKVRVPIRDLDLSREADADILLRRVAVAARQACRGAASGGVMAAAEAQAQGICRREAIAGAMAQVDSPVVQARYAAASRSQRPVKVAEAHP